MWAIDIHRQYTEMEMRTAPKSMTNEKHDAESEATLGHFALWVHQ